MAQSPNVTRGKGFAPDSSVAGAGPFRIQRVAELTGIPATTLRAWERRYGVPLPQRTTTAYRLYTAADVDLIRRMNALVTNGIAPADAARTVLAAPAEPTVDAGTDPFTLARERLLAATHRWDADAIDTELARAAYLVDAQSLFTRLLSPLLQEVGQRWERGELSVAQEHLLSEKIELLVRAQLRSLQRPEGPLAILACVDGEGHVLGLLGAALRMAALGWRTMILGAATPASALGDAVRSMAPRLVGLSVTRPPPNPRALFKAYGKALGKTPWVVGGPAAEEIAAVVKSAGGSIANAEGAAWNQQVREWLRGAT